MWFGPGLRTVFRLRDWLNTRQSVTDLSLTNATAAYLAATLIIFCDGFPTNRIRMSVPDLHGSKNFSEWASLELGLGLYSGEKELSSLDRRQKL